jgi:RNA polymerase sigma-70 factor (ECF subfamily)
MAFEDFFLAYKDKIFRYVLYRVGGDRERAKDMTSEIFMKAWHAYQVQEHIELHSAWIYTIAKHHLIDHYRKRNVQTVDIDHVVIPSAEDPARREDAKLEYQKLLGCIHHLPEGQAAAVHLRYIDQLEIAEVAAVLETSEGAVRVRLSKAVSMLRNLMNED